MEVAENGIFENLKKEPFWGPPVFGRAPYFFIFCRYFLIFPDSEGKSLFLDNISQFFVKIEVIASFLLKIEKRYTLWNKII